MSDRLKCVGCSREFQDGDRFIIDTSSGFTRRAADPIVDDIMAEIFGADDGKMRLCEACTEPGGDYQLETFRAAVEEEGTWPRCPDCGAWMDKGDDGKAVGDCPVCAAVEEEE